MPFVCRPSHQDHVLSDVGQQGDTARDMRDAFETVDLPRVEKVEIANNEFGLKYRMLRQEPKQKFLLFKDGPEPEMVNNWLLDVQLATAVFKADQAAIWLAELGLPAKYEAVVREHLEFYRRKRTGGLSIWWPS